MARLPVQHVCLFGFGFGGYNSGILKVARLFWILVSILMDFMVGVVFFLVGMFGLAQRVC